MAQAQEIRLAGAVISQKRHVCAFFNSRDEEFKVMVPFLAEGLERGDRALNLLDRDNRAAYVESLRKASVDTGAALDSGQLQMNTWEEAYLRPGYFDQYAMLDFLDQQLGANSGTFPLTRLWANMEWALLDRPGVIDIVEYEARVNYLLSKYDDPVVCVYDLSRFNAGVIMDVLRTHPLVIIGGTLQENPFYVPPDEFLWELGVTA